MSTNKTIKYALKCDHGYFSAARPFAMDLPVDSAALYATVDDACRALFMQAATAMCQSYVIMRVTIEEQPPMLSVSDDLLRAHPDDKYVIQYPNKLYETELGAYSSRNLEDAQQFPSVVIAAHTARQRSACGMYIRRVTLTPRAPKVTAEVLK